MHTSLPQMLHPTAPTAATSPTTPTSPTTSSTSSTDPGLDLTQTFLQLLSVQLENQSPLNPIDPNQFTSQLAQFDSLGALTQIQSLMQTLVNDVGGSSSPVSGTGGSTSTSANSTSTPSLNSVSH